MNRKNSKIHNKQEIQFGVTCVQLSSSHVIASPLKTKVKPISLMVTRSFWSRKCRWSSALGSDVCWTCAARQGWGGKNPKWESEILLLISSFQWVCVVSESWYSHWLVYIFSGDYCVFFSHHQTLEHKKSLLERWFTLTHLLLLVISGQVVSFMWKPTLKTLLWLPWWTSSSSELLLLFYGRRGIWRKFRNLELFCYGVDSRLSLWPVMVSVISWLVSTQPEGFVSA